MAFDTQTEIAWKIRRTEGEQTAVVRFPTDQEWVEYRRSLRIVQQNLGRGATETDINTAEPDLKLYQKIRLPESPDLSADEAVMLIGVVAHCNIQDVTLNMDEASVDLQVLKTFRVKHRLRIPTTAEVVQFKRAQGRQINLPHGRSQYILNLHAGADLYDKCLLGTEGYANGSVPVLHRDAAMRAVISACEEQTEAPSGEDF
jgi:hypothetical protein